LDATKEVNSSFKCIENTGTSTYVYYAYILQLILFSLLQMNFNYQFNIIRPKLSLEV
jgi:hypothetical protein